MRHSSVRPAAVLAALAIVSATACIRTRTDPVTGKLDVDVESPLKKGEDWRGNVTGQGSFASATGSARAAVINGQTSITVRVTGLPAYGQHPWRVYENGCGSVGPVFGDAAQYGTISVSAEGVAEGTARVAGTLNEARDYQVRLYASPSDTATVVACATLKD